MDLEILECDICRENFDLCVHIPYIYNYCGHTFCYSCIVFPDSNTFRPCAYCKRGNGTGGKLTAFKNYKLIETIEELNNRCPLSLIQFIINRHLFKIPIICKRHNDIFIVYDLTSEAFGCENCIENKQGTINIKRLLIEKTNMVEKNEKDLNGWKEIIDKVAANQMKHEIIKTSLTELVIVKHILSDINNLSWITNDNITDDIEEIIMSKLGPNISKLDFVIEKGNELSKMYNDALYAAKTNMDICYILKNKNYDIKQYPGSDIKFQRQVEIIELDYMHQILQEKANCLNYKLKQVFCNCMSQLKFLNITRDQLEDIELIVKRYYKQYIVDMLYNE